jgi:hypothetical protein
LSYNILSCPLKSLLQQPLLSLDMSVLHQPVLHPELPLDVSVIQQPVLPLDVSAQQTVVIRDRNRKKQQKQNEFRFFSVQTENIFCLFRGHPIQNRDEEQKKSIYSVASQRHMLFCVLIKIL